jgi:hypothetical protein
MHPPALDREERYYLVGALASIEMGQPLNAAISISPQIGKSMPLAMFSVAAKVR